MIPPFNWPVRVRFVDTDASGRIHYTAMLRFFEAAEFEFLRHIGITYDDMPDCGFPRVHVECDYKSIARHEDLLTVTVAVEQVGNSSFTYEFHATCGEREIAQGKITVVCLAAETMKARALPGKFREALLKSR